MKITIESLAQHAEDHATDDAHLAILRKFIYSAARDSLRSWDQSLPWRCSDCGSLPHYDTPASKAAPAHIRCACCDTLHEPIRLLAGVLGGDLLDTDEQATCLGEES